MCETEEGHRQAEVRCMDKIGTQGVPWTKLNNFKSEAGQRAGACAKFADFELKGPRQTYSVYDLQVGVKQAHCDNTCEV
jgi:hypothetical protein